MGGTGGQTGTSTLEVMVSLILVTFAAAGLAVAAPLAYGRSAIWRNQYNVARHLEQHLETLRATPYDNLVSGETALTEEGFSCQTVTRYVKESTDATRWVEAASASGAGLNAEYYSKGDFSGTRVSRIDATINFNWGNAAPVSGIGTDGFSVRWTGWVEAPVSGNYIFSIESDDGARLWLNRQPVIDHWDSAGSGSTAALNLTGGQKVAIQMDYHEVSQKASAYLRWSGPSIGQQVIPSRYLYSSLAKLTRVKVGNALGTQEGRLVSFADATEVSNSQPLMWVAQISMNRVYQLFPWDYVVVRVKVCDGNGAPLPGVTVTGVLDTWFSNWTLTAITGSDGIAVMDATLFLLTAEFTVSNLTKPGYTYQSNLNVETSDSISIF